MIPHNLTAENYFSPEANMQYMSCSQFKSFLTCEASALADRSVFLPISPKTESLNAAVAAAIFMWEQSQG